MARPIPSLTRFYLLCTFTLVLLAMITAWQVSMAHAKEADPGVFVSSLGNQVIDILKTNKEDTRALETSLDKALEKGVDVKWIARFVLGKHWRQATDAQKEKYLSLYRPFIVRTYSLRFKEYSGETFTVLSSTPESNGTHLVKTEIKRPQGQNVNVDYRVRPDSAGNLKIFDVIVEGVSLLNTQRSEFDSVVSRQGMDQLNALLEQKIKSLSAGA